MSALLIYSQALVWMMLCNAVVYAGLFFINSELLTGVFSGIYEATNYWSRVFICLVTFLTLGNIMFTKGFQWFDAQIALPMNIIAFVLIQIIISLILSKSAPNLMVIPATFAVCASVFWVYTLIK